jgi:hypothetical protein
VKEFSLNRRQARRWKLTPDLDGSLGVLLAIMALDAAGMKPVFDR